MDENHLDDIQLFEYASGELDEAERREAEKHLHSCEECGSMLALAQQGASVLKASQRFELPAERTAATLAGLGSQTGPEVAPVFWRRRWVKALAPAAAIAGVIVVIVLVGTGDDSPADEAATPTLEATPAPAPQPESASGGSDRSLQSSSDATDSAASEAPAAQESLDEAAVLETPAEEPEPARGGAPDETMPAEAAPEPEEAGAPTDDAPAESAPTPQPATPQPATPEPGGLIAAVAGPAEDVVALLSSAGIEATIADDGAVEVPLDAAAQASAALATRPAGPVSVRAVEDR